MIPKPPTCRLLVLAIPGVVALPALLSAAISGHVRAEGSLAPVAGAEVRLQADPASPAVLTAVDGSFLLPVSPAGAVIVTAAVPYDRGAPVTYNIGGTSAVDGQTNAEILLPVIPAAANPAYLPPTALNGCGFCHADQYAAWLESSHALAGTDPWVADLHSGTGTPGGSAGYVFRNTHDPGETGFCATCHTPMADVFDPGNVQLDEVTSAAGLDGVNCVACHQIDSVDGDPNGLHHLGSATYRFPEATEYPTELRVWGPLGDVDYPIMRAAYAPFFREARLCASCHQYVNPETGAPGQNTYGEWLASTWAVPGPGFRSCRDCHMEPAAESGPICTVLPLDRPAEERRAHDFPGSTPDRLAAAILLRAEGGEEPGRVRVAVEVENAGAGHAWPTGISIRNALVAVTATWNGQALAQVSGPVIPWWADDEVPGKQPGDLAGDPGTGFAKVLEGRINGQGPVVRPVLFIDAEGVNEDSLIPAGGIDLSEYRFAVPSTAEPGDTVEVEARLLYRRSWRALAVTKGWTVTPQGGPIEVEVARVTAAVPLTAVGAAGSVLEIPALGAAGVALLALLLAASALARLRRRPVA